jgi:hypothetical protein
MGIAMASLARAEHLSRYQHVSSSPAEALARLARSAGALLRRWAAAHSRRVQDRLFWELALTDPRVMAELQAIHAHDRPADSAS